MFFLAKLIASSRNRLKKKRFLNFWEVNLQKRKRNFCFPSQRFFSVLSGCFLEISFVTLCL